MSADGKWKVVVHTPMGPQEAEVDIKTDGNTFQGHIKGDNGEDSFVGQLEGDRLTWKNKITNPMPLEMEFDTKLSGDEMEGTAKLGHFGDAKVTGTRI